MLIFTSLTTFVTLLHLDKFHFGSPVFTASAAAWAWLVVYVAVPPLLLAALVFQRRSPGSDRPGNNDLPKWIVACLYVAAGAMAILGPTALLNPDAFSQVWPWPVTPLTARAIGAWLLALAVAAAEAADANDVADVRGLARAFTALGALQLLALARYGNELDWVSPSAWIYLLFVGGIAATGVGMMMAPVRATSRAPATGVG